MAKDEPVPTSSEPVPVDPQSTPADLDEPVLIDPVPVEPDDDRVVITPEPVEKEVDEPLTLIEDYDDDAPSKVKAREAGSPLDADKIVFKRTPNVNGTGAIRCRVFHSRIALAPLEYMQTNINEWIDNNEIEIKHVGHVIGLMEGKSPEPNMVVMVWY